MRKIIRWLLNNFGNFLTVGGWVVSAGFFPTLLKLTSGATLLEYGVAAVSGLIAFAVFRACWNLARVMKATAVTQERLSSDSSAFDPMARVFENKRLHLRDLVPAGRRQIIGRKFINCEIIGPGNIVVSLRSSDTLPFPTFLANWFNDVDMIQIIPGKASHTAIYFPDCSFEACYFFNINLLFYERSHEEWWWVTPDPAQPRLIEGETNGKAK